MWGELLFFLGGIASHSLFGWCEVFVDFPTWNDDHLKLTDILDIFLGFLDTLRGARPCWAAGASGWRAPISALERERRDERSGHRLKFWPHFGLQLFNFSCFTYHVYIYYLIVKFLWISIHQHSQFLSMTTQIIRWLWLTTGARWSRHRWRSFVQLEVHGSWRPRPFWGLGCCGAWNNPHF